MNGNDWPQRRFQGCFSDYFEARERLRNHIAGIAPEQALQPPCRGATRLGRLSARLEDSFTWLISAGALTALIIGLLGSSTTPVAPRPESAGPWSLHTAATTDRELLLPSLWCSR